VQATMAYRGKSVRLLLARRVVNPTHGAAVDKMFHSAVGPGFGVTHRYDLVGGPAAAGTIVKETVDKHSDANWEAAWTT